jgi:hypothetical protein
LIGDPVTADGESRNLLDAAEAARTAARQARPRVWLPVMILGGIVALAMPLYIRLPFDQWTRFQQPPGVLQGFSQLEHPAWAVSYWLIALPLAYAAIAWYLVSRSNRRGVRINTSGIVGAGAVLFLLLVTVTMIVPQVFRQILPGNLTGRGLLPLLVISVGLLIWAVMLRRLSLAIVGVAALAASLLSNLYNLDNPLRAAGLPMSSEYGLVVNVALTAVVLLVGAAVLAVTERN